MQNDEGEAAEGEAALPGAAVQASLADAYLDLRSLQQQAARVVHTSPRSSWNPCDKTVDQAALAAAHARVADLETRLAAAKGDDKVPKSVRINDQLESRQLLLANLRDLEALKRETATGPDGDESSDIESSSEE